MNTSSKLDQPRPFGRFLLTHKIAAGGMATVWKAETRSGDPLHGRPLAIKILHNHLSDSDDFIRMFRDEGHLAKQLEHANVVRVYEVDEVDGDQYLAMEYVEGRNVAQLINAARLNSTTLPAGVVFEVLRQVLTALAYVHGVKGRNGRPLGIVHRDISPQNILISKDLIVKVTDFGIARGKHRSDQTRTGTVKGKLHYMAPEQAAGHRVDHRADLYALGAVAFEMLTGQPVLGVDATAVVQGRTIRGELDLSAKFRSQPEDVKAWLLKSLARLPDERFQSAEAMLGAMEALGKASRRYYRPDNMLQWLELDEARGSQQRRRELFVGDEAVASGRVQAGAVHVQGETNDASRRRAAGDVQRPVSRVHVSPADREARMQRSVDWRVTDDAALDVPAMARTGQRRAIVAPQPAASAASGGRPAVVVSPTAAPVVAAKPPLDDADAMQPASLRAQPAERSQRADAAAGERRARPNANEPKPVTRVTRAEAEYRQGMLMAQVVAACCAALLLFGAALHAAEMHLPLPPLREDMVASLWDEEPVRTDAVARSAPGGKGAVVAAKPAPRVVPVAPPQPQLQAAPRDPVAEQLEAWAVDDPASVASPSDEAAGKGKASDAPESGSDDAVQPGQAGAVGATDAAASDAAPADEEAAPVVPRVLSDEELAQRGWEGREIQAVARPGELDPAEKAAQKKRKAEEARTAAAAAAPTAAKPHPVVASAQDAAVGKSAAAGVVAKPVSGAPRAPAPGLKAAAPAPKVAGVSKPPLGAKPVVVGKAGAVSKTLPVGKSTVVAKPVQATKPAAGGKVAALAKPAVAGKPGLTGKPTAPAKGSPARAPVVAAKPTAPAKGSPVRAPVLAAKPSAAAKANPGAKTSAVAKGSVQPGKPLAAPAAKAKPAVGGATSGRPSATKPGLPPPAAKTVAPGKQATQTQPKARVPNAKPAAQH